MNVELAKQLIQKYVDGWKENDIEKIIAPLSDECVIIESHGPTYQGIKQVKKWFEYWVQEKGRVIRWEITSFYFLGEENTAFFEWDFTCNAAGKGHELLGISLVKFSGGKISFLHEYRMTKKS
ncbi:MAG: nuclear transport factor 2 family protein [Candidatus Wildermuthbacteria bacterium]|nr:nuclear transport factor 2 family protein [Candidatus Wildermuthbacteria bacterium]